jgi:hypothetical protein
VATVLIAAALVVGMVAALGYLLRLILLLFLILGLPTLT